MDRFICDDGVYVVALEIKLVFKPSLKKYYFALQHRHSNMMFGSCISFLSLAEPVMLLL